MFNTLIQLYIERRLSGAKPYLASHPDLGVPLGIFNYKDEPNKDARIKSIKKYGVKGNPYSYRLAKKYGIKNPIPSYQSQEELEKENELLREKIRLLEEAETQTERNRVGISKTIQNSADFYTKLENEVKQTNLSMSDTIALMLLSSLST